MLDWGVAPSLTVSLPTGFYHKDDGSNIMDLQQSERKSMAHPRVLQVGDVMRKIFKQS